MSVYREIDIVDDFSDSDDVTIITPRGGAPDDNSEVTIVDPDSPLPTENDEVPDNKQSAYGELKNIEPTGENFNESVDTTDENTNEEFGEVLEVADIEAVPTQEREIEEDIFIRVMEDDMLRDVPVALQNNLSVQERIRKKARDIWNLKQRGDHILAQEKAGEKEFRPMIDSLDQGFFHLVPWVVPVVLDTHMIYALRCQKLSKEKNQDLFADNQDDNDEEFNGEIPFGDKLEDQIAQMKTIQKLITKLYNDEINYVSYASGSTHERDPYRPVQANMWEKISNLPKSYRLRLRTYEQLVRYINIYKKPKTRVGRAPFSINVSVPEKQKRAESIIKRIQDKKVLTAVSGEEINIVGFLVLPLPPYVQPEEMNKTIKQAVANTKIIKIKDKLEQIDPRVPKLLLFENGKTKDNQIPFQFYTRFLRTFVPTSEQAIDYVLEEISEPDILSVGEALHQWGAQIGTLRADMWQKARDAIAKTASEDIPRSITGLRIEDLGELCNIKTPHYLLRDDQYRSKFMRMFYKKNLGYTDDLTRGYRGVDCLGHRFNRLYRTDDNGSFYYSFSFLHIKRPSIQKEIQRLSALQKKYINEQKRLHKEAREGTPNKIEFPQVDEEVNLIKIRESFNRLMSIPKKVSDAREKLLRLEKETKDIIQAQKKLENQKAILEESAYEKAGRLFLYQMGETAALIKKQGISEVDIGRILYERDVQNKKIEEERPEFKPLFQATPSIQGILDQINRMSNIKEKIETIYSIIEYDGMLIDRFIYSVRFGEPIFCGHWFYVKLADRALKTIEREQWVQQLLSIFGSDSKKEGSYNCVVCGSYLDRTSFYESMHFDQFGRVEANREAYIDEKRHKAYLHSQTEKFEDTISTNVKLCRGATLKSEIASRGLKEKEDTKRAVIACDILDRILAKMDITITPKQFLGIILISVQDSKTISSFPIFLKEKIREVKLKKKIDEHDAARLEQNEKFNEMMAISYSAYFISRFATLVASHLLWHLRTAVPPQFPGPAATTSCSFFGFDGEVGYEYVLCLLEEMKTVRARLTIRGKKIDKPVKKKEIDEHFRYWLRVQTKNYKYALQKRIRFETEEKRFSILQGSKRTDTKEKSYDWSAQDIPPISDHFISELYKAWKTGDGEKINNLFNHNNLRAKRLSFQLRADINSVFQQIGSTDIGPQYIETTCCEQRMEDDLPFLEFYEEFKPKLKTIENELQILQKQLDLMKEHGFTTQFAIRSIEPPLRNMSRYPIKNTEYPDSFIREAFLAFCHDGPSKGEYHNFQNTEFEEITRCLKCGWFRKKLETQDFSKDQFTDLLDVMYKRTLADLPTYKVEVQNKKWIAMKREASRNLNNDIHKLSTRLARILARAGKGESEGKMRKRFEEFLQSMDNFRLYIPDAERSLQDSSDQVIVETNNRRNYFAQQKMKEYINEFLRRYISKIVNSYKPKIANLPWLSGKNLEKWQQRLLSTQLWLEPFLTKTNKTLFKKFVFDYTANEISDISGITDIYGPDWKWILKPSLFTPIDAAKVLKHYFVTQIILFLDISGAGEPVFAEFINHIFDLIDKDNQTLNVPQKDITKWNDTRTEERVLAWARYYDAIREEDALLFNAPYRTFTEIAAGDPFAPKEESSLVFSEDSKFDKDIDGADKESYLMSKAKEELGEDATEQALESYVQDAIQEDDLNEEINEEVYDNQILKEGEEVMDVGTEYGQQPQGTETAGDGFNDYTMNEAWDPVHEPDVLGVEQ